MTFHICTLVYETLFRLLTSNIWNWRLFTRVITSSLLNVCMNVQEHTSSVRQRFRRAQSSHIPQSACLMCCSSSPVLLAFRERFFSCRSCRENRLIFIFMKTVDFSLEKLNWKALLGMGHSIVWHIKSHIQTQEVYKHLFLSRFHIQ